MKQNILCPPAINPSQFAKALVQQRRPVQTTVKRMRRDSHRE